MFCPASVCLSVCVCVCLLAISRKKYRSGLHENSTTDVFVDKKELINFWKSSIKQNTVSTTEELLQQFYTLLRSPLNVRTP